MIDCRHLKHINGDSVPITVQHLDESYLPQILKLQEHIYSQLYDKSWYSCTCEEEFRDYLLHTGQVIGCLTPDNQLIALGVYVKPLLSEDNYGHDLNLSQEELLQVGHVEITIVHEDFRGNRLQQYLCNLIESIGLAEDTPIMMATVCPENVYSLNTLLKLGYTIKKEKIKYGGLNRYILLKHL